MYQNRDVFCDLKLSEPIYVAQPDSKYYFLSEQEILYIDDTKIMSG